MFLKGNWEQDTFVTNYLPLLLFPILYFAAKFVTKVPLIRPHEMDFKSGLDEIEADTWVQSHKIALPLTNESDQLRWTASQE